jgi:hypothetical protein
MRGDLGHHGRAGRRHLGAHATGPVGHVADQLARGRTDGLGLADQGGGLASGVGRGYVHGGDQLASAISAR